MTRLLSSDAKIKEAWVLKWPYVPWHGHVIEDQFNAIVPLPPWLFIGNRTGIIFILRFGFHGYKGKLIFQTNFWYLKLWFKKNGLYENYLISAEVVKILWYTKDIWWWWRRWCGYRPTVPHHSKKVGKITRIKENHLKVMCPIILCTGARHWDNTCPYKLIYNLMIQILVGKNLHTMFSIKRRLHMFEQ